MIRRRFTALYPRSLPLFESPVIDTTQVPPAPVGHANEGVSSVFCRHRHKTLSPPRCPFLLRREPPTSVHVGVKANFELIDEAYCEDYYIINGCHCFMGQPSTDFYGSKKLYLLPIYLIVSLGCYGLLMVGVGLMQFPTCPHEALLLQQDIVEAKDYLKQKGVDVGFS
ncbi:hypothetical protein L6164_028621 [Bauhinia variegata]|uniref:Uncharacterized protein n=1 Tax=Bauhinia variegata TaxID=167791 RepID=A0ACB9L6S5_BAUVA|nr:hypothetical protein L6164_028621 [Bauhinia variegata]